MKARITAVALCAVLCATGAAAQADTATTGAPPLTTDTAAPVTTAPTTGTDTAGLGVTSTTTTADTTLTSAASAPVMTADTTLATTTTTVEEEEEEGGFDWNWLGLLGRLGLRGLFKKRGTTREVVHHDTVRPVDRNDPGTRPRV